jgi:tetratricopeptide (TPR) repeat protein
VATPYALLRPGVVLPETGEFKAARQTYDEALERYGAAGDRSGVAFALLSLGDIARDQGQAAALEAFCSKSLDDCRELGSCWGIGCSLNYLALGAAMRSDFERARIFQDEALTLFRRTCVRGGVVELLVNTGKGANDRGDHGAGLAVLREAVETGWPIGPYGLVATGLEEMARVVVARDDPRVAAVIPGSVEAWRGGGWVLRYPPSVRRPSMPPWSRPWTPLATNRSQPPAQRLSSCSHRKLSRWPLGPPATPRISQRTTPV